MRDYERRLGEGLRYGRRGCPKMPRRRDRCIARTSRGQRLRSQMQVSGVQNLLTIPEATQQLRILLHGLCHACASGLDNRKSFMPAGSILCFGACETRSFLEDESRLLLLRRTRDHGTSLHGALTSSREFRTFVSQVQEEHGAISQQKEIG